MTAPKLPGPSLGVVIVNYNTEDLTLQCVKSLLDHGITASRHPVTSVLSTTCRRMVLA